MKTKSLTVLFLFLTISVFSQKKWSLKECINHALEKNITIQQNKLNIDVSKADLKAAKGNFLPTVNGYLNNDLSIPTNDNSSETFGGNLGVQGSYTIFNGFRNLNTYKQAELNIEASKLDLQVLQNDISLQVINAYLNILFARENLNIAKTQLEVSKKQLSRVKTQFGVGAVPKNDVLNIESTVANDTQSVIQNENNLSLAQLNLAQLIQTDPSNFDVQSFPENTDAPIELGYNDYNIIYNQSLKNRPEIKRQNLNINNADLNLAIAKSGYMPTISASGGIGTRYLFDLGSKNENSLSDLPPLALQLLGSNSSEKAFFDQLNDNLSFALSLNVSIPIFNGFKNDANVERAIVRKEIFKQQLENQKLQLKQAIQKAYFDAKLAFDTYDSTKATVEAQKEAFKNAKIGYEYGSITVFDFDQIRNRLVNAQAASVRAKYDLIFKTKVLQFYMNNKVE